MRQNFREWSTLRSFRDIPAGHFSAHGVAKITRSAAHAAQRPDNNHLWAHIRAEIFGDIFLQGPCRRKGLQRSAQRAAACRRPAFERNGRPGISSPIAEGCDATPGVIGEIFQIIKPSAPTLKPLQQAHAVRLALIGMAEHDVPVHQRAVVFWQLFQSKDDRILGGRAPGSCRGQAAPNVIGQRNSPRRIFFQSHLKPGLDKCSHTARGHAHALLIRTLFCANPNVGHKRPFSATLATEGRAATNRCSCANFG